MLSEYFTSLLALATALPLARAQQTELPVLEYPHPNSVWYAGAMHHAKWSNLLADSELAGGTGDLYFFRDGQVIGPAVVTGFDLAAGQVSLYVPRIIEPGDNYILLMKCFDGNNKFAGDVYSPPFTIGLMRVAA